jgi:hypothetical protein
MQEPFYRVNCEQAYRGACDADRKESPRFVVTIECHLRASAQY